MLGKNMSDDFNAERNTHYKLTLVFNKDANDIDWHIDYDYIPKPPEIVAPSPMLISYLSNLSLNIPVSIYFDEKLTDIDNNRASGVPIKYGVLKYVMRNSEMPSTTAGLVPNYIVSGMNLEHCTGTMWPSRHKRSSIPGST